jgi:hypothetical protein
MSWGRLDDTLHKHPKLRKISRKPRERLEAMGLWVLCNSYACDALTDGFVDREFVVQLTGSEKAADRLGAWLVNCKGPSGHGLWDPTEGGWTFHDWANYGPTRQSALQKKAQQIAAASAGGVAKAAAKNKGICVPARQPSGSHPADHFLPPDPDPDPRDLKNPPPQDLKVLLARTREGPPDNQPTPNSQSEPPIPIAGATLPIGRVIGDRTTSDGSDEIEAVVEAIRSRSKPTILTPLASDPNAAWLEAERARQLRAAAEFIEQEERERERSTR